ncbi:hypothetical protein [Candidatus Chazhemtobacterium aquaticus]|nr:hypothetical protein [Candidatus Chazhemtobacterium aquaticus]
MSSQELEHLAPDDPDAAWELFNRILDQGEPLGDLEPDEAQSPSSPAVVVND